MLNKQIIKDAIAEARDIENFAIEQAKKSLEEALMPQIEKAIQESLNGSDSIVDSSSVENATINESASKEAVAEIINENQIQKNIQEMEMKENENLHEEELFEVEGLFEDEAASEETAQEPAEDSVEAKLDDLSAKIDQLIAATQGEEEETSAEGEVEVVDDEAASAAAPEAPATAPTPAPAPEAPAAPAQTVTEDMEEEGSNLEEIMFEVDEDFEESLEEEMSEGGITYEVSLEEDMEEESLEEALEEESYQEEATEEAMKEDMEEEALFELELSEEMEEEGWKEEGVEENIMQNTVNTHRTQERRKRKPNYVSPANKYAVNESKVKKVKAQYESKMGELIKENESLKGVIKNYKSNLKEFENSFVELKSQLNEMQIFNGKLAYANKLLTKGGLTNDEKIRIAEEFDKCQTVEDAKKLYNKIISENNFSNKGAIADKLKSAKPSTAPVQNLNESKSETLFESEERKRMRMLAGIVKPINE